MLRMKTFRVCLVICLLGVCSIFAQETKSGASPAWQKGSVNAKVTIEVFNDYQCPACVPLNAKLKNVEKKFSNDLQIIFRHYPIINMHDKAMLAAQAAEAAGIQGKFWEMSDLIFKNQKKWVDKDSSVDIFTKYAKQLKLNIEIFKTDIDSQFVKYRISEDMERFKFLNLNQTPTVFINKELLNFEDISNLEEVIKNKIKQIK